MFISYPNNDKLNNIKVSLGENLILLHANKKEQISLFIQSDQRLSYSLTRNYTHYELQ